MFSHKKNYFNPSNHVLKRANPVFYIVSISHFLITYFAYKFINLYSGDAKNYWFITKSKEDFINSTPIPLREDLLYYINYIFTNNLNLPFWFGFLIYSCVGLLGIWILYKTTLKLNSSIQYKWIYIPLLLLPSIHFWTSMIGKEPICFLGISLVFYSLITTKVKTTPILIGFILLALVRPHVGIILAFSVILSFLIKNKKISISYFLMFITFSGASLYFLLKSHWLENFSLDNLQFLFQKHHEVLKTTDTYVPLEEYNIFYKVFTFYFRPLPFEINNLWGWISGIENLFSLFIFTIGLYSIFQLIRKRKYALSKLDISIIIFFITLAGVFSLAYSNFGLIARMKNQSLPFMLMLCIYWIGLYFNQKKHGKT
ncbi:hypothetical protein NLM59_03055 [Weeksellaceae bacterium KMM 9724]|uniref:hypothetical protein n=1 Tax=Profundicola chukchiensis TaxID=2961959 RepID=UPI002437CAA9|nr:hypothetical protein [Profundicola chukchiensis]MDG4949892.1 hypothetical protein [Profundicola chukchiensis]